MWAAVWQSNQDCPATPDIDDCCVQALTPLVGPAVQHVLPVPFGWPLGPLSLPKPALCPRSACARPGCNTFSVWIESGASMVSSIHPCCHLWVHFVYTCTGGQADPTSCEFGLLSLPGFNQVKTFTHNEPLTGGLNLNGSRTMTVFAQLVAGFGLVPWSRVCPATRGIADCYV